MLPPPTGAPAAGVAAPFVPRLPQRDVAPPSEPAPLPVVPPHVLAGLAEPVQPPKYKPAVKHSRFERRMRELPVWMQGRSGRLIVMAVLSLVFMAVEKLI